MGKKILVVDDDEGIREAFVAGLEDSGYEVLAVESGEKGIEEVKKGGYGLIFLDLKMPKMDGVTALRGIHGVDPKVPVYIITAFYGDFMVELQNCARAGIHFEVMEKPFTADQMLNVVRSVFDQSISCS